MKISLLRVVSFSILATFLLLPRVGRAQETWTFDSTFQRTPLRVTSEGASGVKVLSLGKVLVYTINGGLLSGANAQRIGALIRIDPNTGAIDPTWNPDPTLTASGFLGVAESPDGKIYYATALVGDLVDSNGLTDPAVHRLVRLNADGTRDTSFNSPNFAIGARFLGVQPDGKVIVCSGGLLLHGVPPADSIVETVRLNTDGSLDMTFQSPNFQQNANDPPASVASGNYFDAGVFGNPVFDSPTGKIYFCGGFRFVNGQPRKGIVRCNADGTVDSSFVPTGLAGGSTIIDGRAMVLQPSGKIVLGGPGLRTAAGGSTRYNLLRFDADGTLDPTFTLVPTTTSSGTALVPGYFGPRDIHAVPGGNILTSDIRVLRFLAGGTLDSAFTPLDYTSPYFTNGVDGIVGGARFDVNPNTGEAYLQTPGPLYARLGGVPVGNITKLTPGGTIDTQFDSPVVESENFAPDVQIAASGAVYVSGRHTDFGNAANATISRLLGNGTRDPTYTLGALPFADKQAVEFALLPGGGAYAIYDSGSFRGGYRFNNLVRLLPTGALDTSFRPSSALQMAFSINAFDGNDTGKVSVPEIVPAPNGGAYFFSEGGVFSRGDAQLTVNANGNLRPFRMNADGTEDNSVPALGFPVGEVTRDGSSNSLTGGSTGYIRRLAQTADGGFLVLVSVAPFPTLTGAPYNFQIIKLRADGSQDLNFTPTMLTLTAPAFLNFPVLFDPVTGTTLQPPNGFYFADGFPISSAATFPDGSFVVAGIFALGGGSTTYSLRKLTVRGTLDTSFNPQVVVENTAHPTRPAIITKVRVAPDSKIWVLGRFDTIGGQPAPGVARLNSDGTLDSAFALTGVSYYDSFGDSADVVFANSNLAYLVGTFRQPGEPVPFAVTRIRNTAPPGITSPGSAFGTSGGTFNYQITASGDPTGFNATGLPAGLTINTSTGVISGTPTVSGRFQIVVSATDSSNITTSRTVTITLAPAGAPPMIISPSTASGTTGQQFTYQVLTNAPASIAVSNLPGGLSFDPNLAAIVGIPSEVGTFNVGLSASNANGTTNATLVLAIQPPPASGPIITSSTAVTGRTGRRFLFQVVTSGGSPAERISASGLPPGLTIDPVTGIISGTVTADGSFAVTLTVIDGSATTTSTLQLTVTSDPTIPVIISPGTASLTVGQFFSYTINAPSSAGPSDPTIFSRVGPLPAGLGFNAATGTISGTFIGPLWRTINGKPELTGGVLGSVQLFATNSHGTSTFQLVFLAAPNGAVNISTRLLVGTGDNVLIGGFIVQGNAPKVVIIRAIGPSSGVPGALADPVLELHGSAGVVVNDNWKETQEAVIRDSGVPPTDDRESAIVISLEEGAYTAIVKGKNDTTGIALVEVFDLGAASLDPSAVNRLANISTRGKVQTGDDVMIGGFIISGQPTRVVARAVAPRINDVPIPGALEDSRLELRDSSGVLLAANDDWRSDQEQEIIAAGLAPADPRESAIVRTLAPGACTAIVRGKNDSTGVGLVEVFVLE